MTKIYVGNLPFSANESEVRDLFSQHGTVESVSLITDRETGRPRGFGFVEMSRADATRAIQSLNGKDMGGRPLRVNEAQEAAAVAVVAAPAVVAAARSAGNRLKQQRCFIGRLRAPDFFGVEDRGGAT
jgi:RNA recognition motif-containing protein